MIFRSLSLSFIFYTLDSSSSLTDRQISCYVLKVSKMLAQPMFEDSFSLEMEPWCFEALTAVTSLLTKIEEMLSPETEALAVMLSLSSSSIVGMLLLQTLGKFSMLFLSKSDRDAKLVTPSWVRRSTEASELSFVLLEDLNHSLSAWVVTGIVKTWIDGFAKVEITKLSELLKCEPKVYEACLTLMIWATQHPLLGPFWWLRQLNGHV